MKTAFLLLVVAFPVAAAEPAVELSLGDLRKLWFNGDAIERKKMDGKLVKVSGIVDREFVADMRGDRRHIVLFREADSATSRIIGILAYVSDDKALLAFHKKLADSKPAGMQITFYARYKCTTAVEKIKKDYVVPDEIRKRVTERFPNTISDAHLAALNAAMLEDARKRGMIDRSDVEVSPAFEDVSPTEKLIPSKTPLPPPKPKK